MIRAGCRRGRRAVLWTVVLGTTQLIGCGCGSLLDRPRDMAPADAADVGMRQQIERLQVAHVTVA